MDSSVIGSLEDNLKLTVSPSDETWNNRTLRLIGESGVEKLKCSSILIVGLGGVGGYAAEMLARSGIGAMTLIDADDVAESNLNRQLIALRSSLGESKVILFARRFHDINPEASIDVRMEFLSENNLDSVFARKKYDFVVDAIDTVSPKVALIAYCQTHGIPIISSMGAGGRIDVSKIGYFDLWDTREDGLARAVRQKLKSIGLRKPLKVVASTEKPMSHSLVSVESLNKRTSYGTLATIPSVFGIYMANHVIRKITGL